MASGMAQCSHCHNSRWEIVAGANVCSECGREYQPRLSRASLNGARHLDQVTVPIAVGEAYDAQTKSRQPYRPRVSEPEQPLVSPIPDLQPPDESGADLAGSAAIAASPHPDAGGRRRLLVLGASAILLVFLFVLVTLALH
jgi:hypothetical protein